MKLLEDIYTESLLYPSIKASFEERWDSMVQTIADLYFNLSYIDENDEVRNICRELQNEIEPILSLVDAYSKLPKTNIRNTSLKNKITKIQGLFNAISMSIIHLSDDLIEQKNQAKLDILEKIESILYTPAVLFDRIFFKPLYHK
jgi:hypothetical protein